MSIFEPAPLTSKTSGYITSLARDFPQAIKMLNSVIDSPYTLLISLKNSKNFLDQLYDINSMKMIQSSCCFYL